MNKNAAIAQLVEHQFPKLKVAGSIPVCRYPKGKIGFLTGLFSFPPLETRASIEE